MNADFINPFINATKNVLETMAYVKAKVGKPYLKKDDIAQGAVSSVIGITGQKNGTISVTFDEGSILKIVSNMFGEEMKTLDNEVSDAVGELGNMISGQARRELETKGHLFDGAVPTVIIGENHRLIHMTDGPKIAIPFTVEAGKFTIKVCLEAD